MISAKKRQEEVEVMNDMSDHEEDELYKCHEESFEVKRRRNK
jgi:hypothetical protein